jgi:3-deoxy-alpha-D-manno-octulosonate 8-oxidase
MSQSKQVVIVADGFFESDSRFQALSKIEKVLIIYYKSSGEPTTDYVDSLMKHILDCGYRESIIIGIGGGSVMDTAKAVSNLLTNPGSAKDYQGWDLVINPPAYKIGIPTLFGTGAETSRTCVLLDVSRNLKLGMNSNFSMFDHLIIDSKLSQSAPIDIQIFTAMDGFFHAMEILCGQNRNQFSDEFAKTSLTLAKAGLLSGVIDAPKIALSSFFGGLALANGIVGLVHPFSAALSVVYGIPHGRANCMAMYALAHYYPEHQEDFYSILRLYKLEDKLLFRGEIAPNDLEQLYEATIIHSKPLTNHLGANWEAELTRVRVIELFTKILRR